MTILECDESVSNLPSQLFDNMDTHDPTVEENDESVSSEIFDDKDSNDPESEESDSNAGLGACVANSPEKKKLEIDKKVLEKLSEDMRTLSENLDYIEANTSNMATKDDFERYKMECAQS